MVYVFDTNAVIYFLQGRGDFPEFSSSDVVIISSITRLELLSGTLTDGEAAQANVFLGEIREREVSKEVIDQAILPKKSMRIRVPDAIILATTIVENAVLVTADKELIEKADRSRCHNPLP